MPGLSNYAARPPRCWNGIRVFRRSKRFTVKRSRPKSTSKPGTAEPPAPRAKPSRRASDTARNGADALRDVQARFAAAIMAPLNDDWDMQASAPNGRPMADVVAEFI